MTGKFKILCTTSLLAVICIASKPTSLLKKDIHPPRLIIDEYYYAGNFDGKIQHDYTVLRAFLVNYSDDTLKYWGSEHCFRELFKVKGKPDMHFEDKSCDNNDFKLMRIPPHRSRRIPLKLSTDKKLKGIFDLKVDMKFYRWNKVGNFHDDIKNHPPVILSDIITLKFNEKENPYTTKADWMEIERKRRQIMPTTDLYLLSEEDRKQLTVSIDKNKISKPVDYNDPYSIKEKSNKKLIEIPVVIHNNGNKILKYFSMSCSWQDYYHTN